MYLYSPTLSQISLKNSFGKEVFQILAKIEMTILLQNSGGKVVFLRGGSMEPPLGTNGSKSTLVT